MLITLELTPETKLRMSEMSRMGQRIRAAVRSGLKVGTRQAAAYIAEEKLTGQSLKSRTGFLRKAVQAWMEADDLAIVGVRPNSAVEQYKWLLGGETKTIRPKHGRYLVIPIGDNLTAAGVARYRSPREVTDGFFLRSKGQLLFGRKNGNRGRFRPLFALVTSVTVKGSDALAKGVLESRDDIVVAINTELGNIQ